MVFLGSQAVVARGPESAEVYDARTASDHSPAVGFRVRRRVEAPRTRAWYEDRRP
jgi:hypothetical protein